MFKTEKNWNFLLTVRPTNKIFACETLRPAQQSEFDMPGVELRRNYNALAVLNLLVLYDIG
jgi:hypothetical protein